MKFTLENCINKRLMSFINKNHHFEIINTNGYQLLDDSLDLPIIRKMYFDDTKHYKFYLGDTQDMSCKACSPPCKECYLLAYECISCENSNFLYSKSCINICPSGFWGDESERVCKTCSVPCKNCFKNSSTCSSCLTGYFLNSNSCLTECPSGFFGKFDS